MKKMLLSAGLVALVAFAGCTSLPTLQEQFSTGCAAVNGDLQIVGASPLLTADQKATINTKVLPANQAICKAGAQLNVSDLKAFHDSLLPAAVAIVQAVPAIPDQTVILIGLQTFGPIVQSLVDQIITAETSPAAAVPGAASAPIAASQ